MHLIGRSELRHLPLLSCFLVACIVGFKVVPASDASVNLNLSETTIGNPNYFDNVPRASPTQVVNSTVAATTTPRTVVTLEIIDKGFAKCDGEIGLGRREHSPHDRFAHHGGHNFCVEFRLKANGQPYTPPSENAWIIQKLEQYVAVFDENGKDITVQALRAKRRNPAQRKFVGWEVFNAASGDLVDRFLEGQFGCRTKGWYVIIATAQYLEGPRPDGFKHNHGFSGWIGCANAASVANPEASVWPLPKDASHEYRCISNVVKRNFVATWDCHPRQHGSLSKTIEPVWGKPTHIVHWLGNPRGVYQPFR